MENKVYIFMMFLILVEFETIVGTEDTVNFVP